MSSAIVSPSIKSDQHYSSTPKPYSSSYFDNVLMTDQSSSKEPVTAFRDMSDSKLSPSSSQPSTTDFALPSTIHFALPFTHTSPLSSSTNLSIEQPYSTTLSSTWLSNVSETNGVTQASVEKDGN